MAKQIIKTEQELDDELEKELSEEVVDEDNPTHYVNNKELYKEMAKFAEECALAEKENRERPRIPEYIGSCILLICEGLGKNYRFRNYPFKEEMISDAIETNMKYIHNFNPKYKNAYGYINRLAWNAFVNRINLEERQRYYKAKMMQKSGIDQHFFETQDHDNPTDSRFSNTFVEFCKENDEFVEHYEEKMEEKKKKRKEKARQKRAEKKKNNLSDLGDME